jgi:hypothetical protein
VGVCCFSQPTGAAAIQFISTAPLIVLNARGAGQHTVFVGQFDFTIYARSTRTICARGRSAP